MSDIAKRCLDDALRTGLDSGDAPGQFAPMAPIRPTYPYMGCLPNVGLGLLLAHVRDFMCH